MRLPTGGVVGEMIPLHEATEVRIREAGERLRKRQIGIDVALQNELWPPIRIIRAK
jgi:hypothetical protein